MNRTIMFVGWLLALIMTSISQGAAFDLEGIVVDRKAEQRQSLARTKDAADLVSADIAQFAQTPGRWECDTPKSEVRIRRVTLCRAKIEDRIPAAIEKFGVIRYRVLVEKGLRGLGPSFEERIDKILGLESGWAGSGVRFVRANHAFDMSVVLAQPSSVDRLCRPLTTRSQFSCAMARNAVINARRWHEGAKTWGANVEGYHHYLVNHEVGHVLGLRHLRCSASGLPAPVMLQQTIDLKGCTANGFVTPADVNSLSRIMPRIRRRFDGFEPRSRKFTKRRTRRRARSRRRYRSRRVSRRSVRRRSRKRRR